MTPSYPSTLGPVIAGAGMPAWLDTLVKQSWTDVQHEVHRKITAARDGLRELMDKIPESEQAAVIGASQAVLRPLAHRPLFRIGDETSTSELIVCPGCNHPGALCVGGVHAEYDLPEELGPMDRLEEVASLTDVYLDTRGLACHVCGLTLTNADELRVAGVASRLELTKSVWPLFLQDRMGNVPELKDLV
jgi:hypothetical protein